MERVDLGKHAQRKNFSQRKCMWLVFRPGLLTGKWVYPLRKILTRVETD
jgi:hypothetical protein